MVYQLKSFIVWTTIEYGMTPKKPEKKKRQRRVGIEAIVEPGVEALYVRGSWMKKLKDLNGSKRKKKPPQK